MDRELKFTIILYFIRIFIHPWGQPIPDTSPEEMIIFTDNNHSNLDLNKLSMELVEVVTCEPDLCKIDFDQVRELMDDFVLPEKLDSTKVVYESNEKSTVGHCVIYNWQFQLPTPAQVNLFPSQGLNFSAPVFHN